MGKYEIVLLGGDYRIACMAELLAEKGYRVIGYGLMKQEGQREIARAASLKEAVESADIVVGGIPLFKEGRLVAKGVPEETEYSLLSVLQKGQKLFAGMLPRNFQKACEERGIECFDFMQEETIAIYNAVATAEGVVAEAIREKDTTVHGSACLVMGYGRCGRVLADKLKGMCARVTVWDNDLSKLAQAQVLGLETIASEQLKNRMGQFEYVFNTIPAQVLNEELLSRLSDRVLVLDIVSGAGGVDYSAAERYGVHTKHCLGLPGKYAPRTSAAIMAEYLESHSFQNGKKEISGIFRLSSEQQ